MIVIKMAITPSLNAWSRFLFIQLFGWLLAWRFGCLFGRRLGRQVQTALLVLGVLPPPAAGARVLTGLDGARARGAADRRIAAIVQRVDGDAVLLGVGAHLFHRPADQRVDLHDVAVGAIDLDLGRLGAGDRLLVAQARHPRLEAGQRAAEWLDLADATALVPVVERIPKAVEALGADQGLDRRALGEVPGDIDAVLHPDPLGRHVGLIREAAGVEREDPHVFGGRLHRQVDDHAVLDGKAGVNGQTAAEAAQGPGHDLGRAGAL